MKKFNFFKSKAKIKWGVLIGIFIISFFVFEFYIKNHLNNNQTVKIVYVGRYKTTKATVIDYETNLELEDSTNLDIMNEIILKKYLKDLGKTENLNFELIIENNHGLPEKSQEIYRKIGRSSDVSLVIDNTWGSDLKACHDIIRTLDIPVITLNGDKNFRDFGRSTVFIGSADEEPNVIAKYLKEVLKKDSVFLISEEAYSLKNVYTRDFKKNDIGLIELDSIPRALLKDDNNNEDSLKFLDKFKNTLRQVSLKKKIPLILNVHGNWGRALLNTIDSTDVDSLTILCPIFSIPSLKKDLQFNNNSNEIIILSSPTDAVPKKAALDLYNFRKQPAIRNSFRRSNAEYFVQRCITAIDIIEFTLGKRKNNEEIDHNFFSRELEALQLQFFSTENNIYAFKENLSIEKEHLFSKLKNGEFYTFPKQFNNKLEEIPSLFLGVKIENIYDIDVRNKSFKADFFYWVRTDIDYIDNEKYLFFKNLKENSSTTHLIYEQPQGDQIFKLYRVNGEFAAEFDLKDYPFDEHEINITAEFLNSSERLKIAIDEKSLNYDEELLNKFTIDDWKKKLYLVTVDNNMEVNLNAFSETKTNRLETYKQLTYRLFIKRAYLTPLIGLILPLMTIGFISILMMYITDRRFQVIGVISGSLLLTVITSAIPLNQIAPATGGLKKIDIIYLLTLFVVLVNFLTVILHNSFNTVFERKLHLFTRIRLLHLILYPISILIIILY